MDIADLDRLPALLDRKVHLEHAFRAAPTDGLIVEFGVWKGTSLGRLAALAGPHRTILGFDSFLGLPDPWVTREGVPTSHPKGHFALHAIPELPKNVTLIAGWFQYTARLVLGSILEATGLPISLLHVDSDLCNSATEALEASEPGLVTGSIVVFDELGNWNGLYDKWREGEWKALNLFIERHPEIRWVPLSRSCAQQASFRIERSSGPPSGRSSAPAA